MNGLPEEAGHGVTVATKAQECRPAPKWVAVVNDQLIPMPQRHVKAIVIREQASVPNGQVLLRDHDSPNDPVIQENAMLDLAEGNVFYSEPAADVTSRPSCGEPPKLAYAVNDRWEIVIRVNQTGRTIRDLFSLPDDVELFRDFESPNDQVVGNDDAAVFADGPVFVTRGPAHRVIEYTVDDEPQSTIEHTLTPTDILRNAGIDPGTHYLVQIIGNTQKSYKETPTEPIHMHQHMKFVSVFTGPTPVS